MELAERTQSLQDMQKERVLWKERDSTLEKVLQEKDALITHLQQAIESSHKDVQVDIQLIFLFTLCSTLLFEMTRILSYQIVLKKSQWFMPQSVDTRSQIKVT